MSARDICSKCGQMFSLHDPDKCPSVVENGKIQIKRINFDDLNYHNIVPLAEIERMYIEKVIEVHRYNLSQSCKAMDISLSCLYKRLKMYGFKIGPRKELRKMKVYESSAE